MQALLLLLRGRWGAEAAARLCGECRPLYCERLSGDVEALCLWLGHGVEPAEACYRRVCAEPYECIPLDTWLVTDEPAAGASCPVPYWLLAETAGFTELSVFTRRAPGPADVYMTPTLIGQLVAVRGCASRLSELEAYIRSVESHEQVVAWVLYPVLSRLCSR